MSSTDAADEDEVHLDAVLAYDRIAGEFGSISDRRRAYLDRVEQIVAAEIPPDSRTLLDVGAGDGARAGRIAKAAGVASVVLLEPSAEMRSRWPADARGWAMRAEELSSKNEMFDAITCLWNVLGHIFPAQKRIEAMRHCARLLAPEGRMFIDVNHRYNAAQYGVWPTALRFLRDRARPSETNGDVVVHWEVGGAKYATDGHVFTHAEFHRLVYSAGLTIEKTFTVNYSTGEIMRSRFAGNPLYVLRRA